MQLGLQRALEAGFTPLITPTLVRPEIMAGTGFLGAARRRDLLPARRRPLPHRHERGRARRVPQGRDPRRVGRPAALRRHLDLLPARGRARRGKDTRGIIRVHQFQKLEMFSYIDPADAEAEHERLLALQEGMLQSLGLSYRVIDTAAGDLGSSAARKYDVEAWVPTQDAYRELTSHLELHHLPGAPPRHPLPHRVGQDGAGRDPQRHARHHPLDRGDPRDAPAGRRLGRRARGAAAVPRRSTCWSPCMTAVHRRALARSPSTSTAPCCTKTARSATRRRARSAGCATLGHEVMLVDRSLGVDDAAGRSTGSASRPQYVVCANGAIVLGRDPEAPLGYSRGARRDLRPDARCSPPSAGTSRARAIAVEDADGVFRYTGTFPEGALAASRQKVEFDELLAVQATRVVVISPDHAIDDFLSVVEQMGLHKVSYNVGLDGVARHRARRRQQGAPVSSSCASSSASRAIACSSIGDGRNDIDMLEWAVAGGGVARRDGAGARRGAGGRDRAHGIGSRRRGRPSRSHGTSRVERGRIRYTRPSVNRRAVRAADGASLENWWAVMSRGFESHALRRPPAPTRRNEVPP